EAKTAAFKQVGLVGIGSEDFKCTLSAYDIIDGALVLPEKTRDKLKIDLDQEVFISPFEYGKRA
ncbi:MAG: arginine N-succinyltransferase, partial [Pseudobdellovibrio sp.]